MKFLYIHLNNSFEASRDYDANIRQMTVRWAIIEMLRHPPKAFEEIIQRHFWIKRDEICKQVDIWINETQYYIDNNSESSKSLQIYLDGLKVFF